MNRIKLTKGILIAIEGIDGTGKSTQTLRLTDFFRRQGFDAVNFREPTDGSYGKQIRQLAVNGREGVTPEEEMTLFINDRKENCEKNLRPALSDKKLVIIDRYYFSTVAYQGALGIDPETILNQNEAVAVIPDLVILLDLDVKTGLNRISRLRKDDHDHFEGEEYLRRVRRIFLDIRRPFIRVIDGSKNEEILFDEMKQLIFTVVSPYIHQE